MSRETEFRIDTRGVAKTKNDEDKISCILNVPSGGKIEKVIVPEGDGIYRVSYIPFEEGCYMIDILYDNIPIPGSPFSVNVQRMSDSTKCKAYGPGLKQGYVNKLNTFIVETKGKLINGIQTTT